MQMPTQSRYQSHKVHETQQTVGFKQKLKTVCRIKADKDITDGIENYTHKQRTEYCNCDYKTYCPFKIQNLQFPLTTQVEMT